MPDRHLSLIRDVTERTETRAELERERERTTLYQKSLTGNSVIEVEIRIEDGDLLGNLSAELDSPCEFEGVITRSDGGLLHYVTITGVGPDDVRDHVSAQPQISEYRVIYTDEEATLVEFAADGSIAQTLVESGAHTRSMYSDGGVTTVVAEMATHTGLQQLIDAIMVDFPQAEVLAKRTVDRPIVTTHQYRDSVAIRLTERQRETLRGAYLAGYFGWPRDSQAKDIASSMGIATSTWLRHLRLAEAALVDWYFEELDS